jgi:hypothetical protein
MFFWIFLAVAAVIFVGFFVWGARGYYERVHKPGTRHLD